MTNTVSLHVLGGKSEEIAPVVSDFSSSHTLQRPLTQDEKEELGFLLTWTGKDLLASFTQPSEEEKEFFADIFNNADVTPIRSSPMCLSAEMRNYPLIGLQTEKAYSLYSSAFEPYACAGIAADYFDYPNAPAILSFGTEDDRFFVLMLYENRKNAAVYSFYIGGNGEQIEGDDFYQPQQKNLSLFRKRFGVQVEDLQKAEWQKTPESVCEYLAKLLELPLTLTYQELDKNLEKHHAERLLPKPFQPTSPLSGLIDRITSSLEFED